MRRIMDLFPGKLRKKCLVPMDAGIAQPNSNPQSTYREIHRGHDSGQILEALGNTIANAKTVILHMLKNGSECVRQSSSIHNDAKKELYRRLREIWLYLHIIIVGCGAT